MTIFRYKKDKELYKIYYGKFSGCGCCYSYKAEKLYGKSNDIRLGKDKNILDDFEVVAVRY